LARLLKAEYDNFLYAAERANKIDDVQALMR
jgi:hypothetical protein